MEICLAYAGRPRVITDEGQRSVMTKAGAESEMSRIWAAGFEDGEGSCEPGNVGPLDAGEAGKGLVSESLQK